jgi:gamma-glutamyl:cysteine ligase YbdK (ATP-grasp superfamily)
VDEKLKALPIVDRILKDFHGRVVNFVMQPRFTFGKELQLHVMEVRPNEPFRSPQVFEETMQEAVQTLSDFLMRKYRACLLGTGMHPLLRLEQTGVWPHRHRQIYEAYGKIFNLKRHGWLNIQSFQLNLPYSDEQSGIMLHNMLANVCAYLPAVAASSPMCEGRFGRDVDNRLEFYRLNQKEVPSVAGDVVPEYVSSFKEYHEKIIGKYSSEMARAGAAALILHREWVNSRGVIFRFDRKAVEIRVMDEQECVKSDVALSCLIRALVRGLLQEGAELVPHEVLVKDFNAVVKQGLEAATLHPLGRTAREVCCSLLKTAWRNASEEEKKYLPLVEKRVENGNLAELIRRKIVRKSQRTDFRDAVVHVYSKLIRSLVNNQPFF